MSTQKELTERRKRASALMNEKGYDSLVLATSENIQYFTEISEPSIHACGVLILSQTSGPVLATMWLDKESVEDNDEEVKIQTYDPYTQGAVIANILGETGARDKIGLDDKASIVLGSSIRNSFKSTEVVNASKDVEELRWIKSDAEINLIEKACKISEQGMKAALDTLRPGTTELTVASISEKEMIALGSDPIKHRTIIASGRRAGYIHPFASHKIIQEGDIVAIDLGAVYHGYCADLSRTAVVGKTNKEITEHFKIFKQVQVTVQETIKPGVSIKELEKSANESATASGYKLIGHLGHGIGLKVEEQPSLRSTRTSYPDLRLRANMTVGFLQTSIGRDRCLGVRVEDTAVITETGVKMLTNYPRELF